MNATKLLSSLILSILAVLADASAAEPKAGGELGAIPPLCQTTALMAGGRAPVILAPSQGGGRDAAERLQGALEKRLGVKPCLVTRLADARPGQGTVIALGNMLDNELLTRLYWSRYCYEDAQFPGTDGYTVHTVFDPHHWGGGHNVVVLGASRPEQLGKAVDRFLGLLEGQGRATALPYVLVVEPRKKLSDASRAKMAARPIDPSFTAFRTNAEQYLKSGEEIYARLAIAALDTMLETYRKNPKRPTPWPEETTAGPIFAAWDAFEHCPLIAPQRRREYLQAWLAWSRDLTRCSYEYRRIDERFTVTWNHTTFALLGLYYAGRYFDRHYGLAEAEEWLRRARLGFAAQARSWKPQEDADSYLVLTMGHTIEFSLADWDLRFFENGLIRRYADYVVGCGDNRQWPAGFGDSGYSSSPTMAQAALPIAYWWTRDAGYRWILEHTSARAWDNPFWREVEPSMPDRFVGLNVFPIDRQIYDDVQRRPTYGEDFEKADVPLDAAWDKISFRENWEPDGQYLLLDGLGRGKHLHFDTNGIVTFVQDGERWLLDHDYLVRNTTEHSMLSVLRDGRSTKLVPSLAGLTASGDLPGMAATHTYVKGYNGVDWSRRLLWSKGKWFLVHDAVTAREAGDYDLNLTWKTIWPCSWNNRPWQNSGSTRSRSGFWPTAIGPSCAFPCPIWTGWARSWQRWPCTAARRPSTARGTSRCWQESCRLRRPSRWPCTTTSVKNTTSATVCCERWPSAVSRGRSPSCSSPSLPSTISGSRSPSSAWTRPVNGSAWSSRARLPGSRLPTDSLKTSTAEFSVKFCREEKAATYGTPGWRRDTCGSTRTFAPSFACRWLGTATGDCGCS